MSNYFSYARVSTKQENDRQSYNRQMQALTRYEKENDIEFLTDLTG